MVCSILALENTSMWYLMLNIVYIYFPKVTITMQSGLVVYTFNPSAQAVDTGLHRVPEQSGVHSKSYLKRKKNLPRKYSV